MFVDPLAPPQKTARELQLEAQLAAAEAQAYELEGRATQAEQARIAAETAAQAELAELRAYRSSIELDKLVSLDGIELESFDPAMAQEFGQKVFKPLTERLTKQF
jgi:hypothetical protein